MSAALMDLGGKGPLAKKSTKPMPTGCIRLTATLDKQDFTKNEISYRALKERQLAAQLGNELLQDGEPGAPPHVNLGSLISRWVGVGPNAYADPSELNQGGKKKKRKKKKGDEDDEDDLDGFIDDTELEDEWCTTETKYGGFYISQGNIEIKPPNENSNDDDDDFDMTSAVKRKDKRKTKHREEGASKKVKTKKKKASKDEPVKKSKTKDNGVKKTKKAKKQESSKARKDQTEGAKKSQQEETKKRSTDKGDTTKTVASEEKMKPVADMEKNKSVLKREKKFSSAEESDKKETAQEENGETEKKMCTSSLTPPDLSDLPDAVRLVFKEAVANALQVLQAQANRIPAQLMDKLNSLVECSNNFKTVSSEKLAKLLTESINCNIKWQTWRNRLERTSIETLQEGVDKKMDRLLVELKQAVDAVLPEQVQLYEAKLAKFVEKEKEKAELAKHAAVDSNASNSEKATDSNDNKLESEGKVTVGDEKKSAINETAMSAAPSLVESNNTAKVLDPVDVAMKALAASASMNSSTAGTTNAGLPAKSDPASSAPAVGTTSENSKEEATNEDKVTEIKKPKVTKPKAPKPHFQWTPETTRLAKEVLELANEKLELRRRLGRVLRKTGVDVDVEHRLFLRQKVCCLWPKGWMKPQELKKKNLKVAKTSQSASVKVKKETVQAATSE